MSEALTREEVVEMLNRCARFGSCEEVRRLVNELSQCDAALREQLAACEQERQHWQEWCEQARTERDRLALLNDEAMMGKRIKTLQQQLQAAREQITRLEGEKAKRVVDRIESEGGWYEEKARLEAQCNLAKQDAYVFREAKIELEQQLQAAREALETLASLCAKFDEPVNEHARCWNDAIDKAYDVLDAQAQAGESREEFERDQLGQTGTNLSEAQP